MCKKCKNCVNYKEQGYRIYFLKENKVNYFEIISKRKRPIQDTILWEWIEETLIKQNGRFLLIDNLEDEIKWLESWTYRGWE